MIIYLDESKKIGQGKFIFGGFFSVHNSNYITKFVELEQNKLGIKKNIELKSFQEFGKLFTEKVAYLKYYKNLNIKTFGFYYKNFYVDNFENYEKVLIKSIEKIYFSLKNYKQEINIIADKTTFKNFKKSEKKLENIINSNFKFQKKVKFRFENSANNKCLQLADLIVGKYKEFYLFDDINYLDDFINFNKIDNFNFKKENFEKI